MLQTPAILGQGSKGRALSDVNVTALALYSTLVDSAAPSFAGCNLGTANDLRGVYCALIGDKAAAGTLTPSGMTIGGVTARRECAATWGFGRRSISIWSAWVPTGTSGTVDVTWSDTATMTAIYLWNAINLRTINAFKGSYAIGDSGADPLGTTFDVPKGGAILAVYGKSTSSADGSGWTGISQDQARLYLDAPTNQFSMSAGSGEFAAAQTALAVNYDMSAGNSLSGFAGIVLR